MTNEECDKMLVVSLPNEAASQQVARQLARGINLVMSHSESGSREQPLPESASLIMTFSGDIGAGKTTIIRAMLKELGVQSTIKSPTFSLVESYLTPNRAIHHFDLYRIAHEDELEYLGFRDYFTAQSLCCIEWAEHAGHSLPEIDIGFKLIIKGAGRDMHITAFNETGRRILACLAGE